ncbi:hypothetical protein [Paenibacillus sinopodophylli]|uniref:hypothetical protein n=1 Tax=Paenibacillus sinopodophylli TaxID=1837342 RepID=UPI00110CB7EA|nr:hypothetical protein [Paenibacillus sinopodophylli]
MIGNKGTQKYLQPSPNKQVIQRVKIDLPETETGRKKDEIEHDKMLKDENYLEWLIREYTYDGLFDALQYAFEDVKTYEEAVDFVEIARRIPPLVKKLSEQMKNSNEMSEAAKSRKEELIAEFRTHKKKKHLFNLDKRKKDEKKSDREEKKRKTDLDYEQKNAQKYNIFEKKDNRYISPSARLPDLNEYKQNLKNQGAYGEELAIDYFKKIFSEATIQPLKNRKGNGIDIAIHLKGLSVRKFCKQTKLHKLINEKELIVNVEVKTESAQLSGDEGDASFLPSTVLQINNAEWKDVYLETKNFSKQLGESLNKNTKVVNLLARVFLREIDGARMWLTVIEPGMVEDFDEPGTLIKGEDEMEKTYNSVQMGAEGEMLVKVELEHLGYRTVALQSYPTSSGIDLVAYKDEELLFIEIKTHLGTKLGQDGLSPSERKPLNFVSKHIGYYAELDSKDLSFTPTKMMAICNSKYIVEWLGLDPEVATKNDIKKEILRWYQEGYIKFKLYHVNMESASIDEEQWGTDQYWRNPNAVKKKKK